MADGKITAVGESGKVTVPSKALKIVDAHGMTVYPGLIDPETNFGLIEIGSDAKHNRHRRALRRDHAAHACG